MPFRKGLGSGFMLATIVFAVVLYLLLPAGVTAFDDDFGYFRSVVLTIQRGFPRTDDWLEPWSASLSGLSAIVFALTGSFTTAVFLPQVLGGVCMFAASFLLLRERGSSAGRAIALALLLATTPTVLWRWGEFTAMVVYVPCLVAALWSCERGRWPLFFLFWAIAVSSRQSAVAWLAIPAWHACEILVKDWRAHAGLAADLRRKDSVVRGLVLWLIASIVFFTALAVLMNRTHSQTVLTANALRNFEPGVFDRHGIVSFGVLVIATGIGALVSAFLQRQQLQMPWRRGKVAVSLLAVIIASLLIAGLRHSGVITNGWSIGSAAWTYWALLILLACVGWTTTNFSLRPSYIAAAIVVTALLGFRPTIYDYYLIDLLLLGFFAAIGGNQHEQRVAAPATASLFRQAVPVALLAWLAMFHGYFALKMKSRLDLAHGTITLAEQAMRRGVLAPADLSFAPFGYVGWKLHPYFVTHDGKDAPFIAGFIHYMESGSVVVGVRDQTASMTAAPEKTIAQGAFPVGLFFRPTILSLQRRRDAPATPRHREMAQAAQLFPLNDAEWRELIRDGTTRPQ